MGENRQIAVDEEAGDEAEQENTEEKEGVEAGDDEEAAEQDSGKARGEADGPLGLRPGDPVRLKKLQNDAKMNGLVGQFIKIEAEEDGGRYVVELEQGGTVRVREANVEKVVVPTRRSERLAQASQKTRKTPAPKRSTRGKAKAEPKAKEKAPVRKTGMKPKASAKSAAAPGAAKASSETPLMFVVSDFRVCSEPGLEVQDGNSRWRPCHLYQSLKDGRIVIWYGGTEYEGLHGNPYKLKGVPEVGGIGYIFRGQPGQLLDGDGARVPARRRPTPGFFGAP
mmetsp:Transcript_46285/g.108437  ORF Transcript_46285/g.108437 Transcript_46285/m.108437 type:complete len:281 (+) Transcript_46285:63-905(+)